MTEYDQYSQTIVQSLGLSEKHRLNRRKADEAGRAELDAAMRTQRRNRDLLEAVRTDLRSIQENLEQLDAQVGNVEPSSAPQLQYDISALPQASASLIADLDSAAKAQQWVTRQRSVVAELAARPNGGAPAHPVAAMPAAAASSLAVPSTTRRQIPAGTIAGVAGLAVVVLVILLIVI